MRCTKCGAPRVPGTKRCWACKAALEKERPSSGEQADPGATQDAAGKRLGAERSAADIPAPLGMAGTNKRCHLCGADCIPDLPQCWNCGTSLVTPEQGETEVAEDASSPPWLRKSWPTEPQQVDHFDVTLPNLHRQEATTPETRPSQSRQGALDRALDGVHESGSDTDGTATNYVPPWVRETTILSPDGDAGSGGLERPGGKQPPAAARGPVGKEHPDAGTHEARRDPSLRPPEDTAPGRADTRKTIPERPSTGEAPYAPQPHAGGGRVSSLGEHECPGAAGNDVVLPARSLPGSHKPRTGPEGQSDAPHTSRAARERVEPVVGTGLDVDTDFEGRLSPRLGRPPAARKVSIWVGTAAAFLGAAVALAWVSFLPSVRGYFAQTTPRLAAGRVATPDGAVERPTPQITELPQLPLQASSSQNVDALPQTNSAPAKEKALPPSTGVKPPPNALALEGGATSANAAARSATHSRGRDHLDPVENAGAGKRESLASSAASAAAPAPLRSGATVYQERCAACHESGVKNAPSVRDVAVWTERLGRGREGLYASVIQGHAAMKSRAGAQPLREVEIRHAVDFMSDQLIAASVERAGKKGYSIHYGPGAMTTTPTEVEAPTAPQAAAPSDWRAQLRAELSACDNRPDNFQQGKCIDMVRWKYCAPSRWGRDPQCPMPTEPPGADDVTR